MMEQEQISQILETKKKKGNLKLKIVFGILLVLIILAGVAIAFGMNYIKDKVDMVKQVDVTSTDLDINPTVAKELKNYRNIALLGIDTRNISNDKGCRSDAIIIASINKTTNDVKLISVYRDSYFYLDDEHKFDKVTHAYAFNSVEGTLKALNRNLDLNIEEAIIVNWKSVANTVDKMGGLKIAVKENELEQLNKYIYDTIGTIGGKTNKIEKAGTYNLDGIQAVTYARIRKGESGGDSARAERMRKVINAAFTKARGMSLSKLNGIVNYVLPTVKTSLSSNEIMSMLMTINKYKIKESIGWPYHYDGWYHNSVWYDPAITLKSNVIQLHEDAFGQKDYEPTDTVVDYSQQIEDATGYHLSESTQTDTNE